jgi:hypothetical protein
MNYTENFHTNSDVHSINVRNKHYLHRPTANLSRFWKRAYHDGIKSLINVKAQFKAAIKIL